MGTKPAIGIAVLVVVLALGALFLLNSSNSTQSPSSSQDATVEDVSSENTIEDNEEAIDSAMQEETRITLSSNGFSPSTVTIDRGEKVVWVNSSGTTATVHSNPHPVHTNYSELNLGQFLDEEELSLIFPNSGTYNYHNHLNASQQGTIIVR